MSREDFDWFSEDARMVEEEADQLINSQKRFLWAEECLAEWDEHTHTFTIAELDMARDGMEWYLKHYIDDLDNQ
jgi:hypothetical protein